jgi:DNA-binding CsgD family transcriptional regulator
LHKHSASLARIRQLCHFALPGEILVPSALHELSRLAPQCSAAYFWFDPDGSISNCYADRLPQATMGETEVHDRTVANSQFVEGVLKANHAGSTVHVDVVHGGRLKGCLSAFRRMDAPPLKEREVAAVQAGISYLAKGLQRAEAFAGYPLHHDEPDTVAQEELTVCDEDGEVVHATEASQTVLLLSTDMPIGPLTISAARSRVQQVLKTLCQRALAESEMGDYRRVEETRWGRFSFKVSRLQSKDLAGRRLVAIQSRRHKPARLHLLDLLQKAELSERQREVALLISMGHKNEEIARAMKISVNTVCYHVKCLFEKLGVHSRAELFSRLMVAP